MAFQYEPYEIEYEGRRIDLRRFAYDVFVFSARKFRVPSKAIPQNRWYVGPKNNYGHPDFLSVIFKFLFREQIKMRFDLNILFEEYCDKNKLDKLKNITDLWNDSYDKKKYPKSQFPQNLRLSLALTNELLLFLYSKEIDFYQIAIALAEHWVNWARVRRSRFKALGGIGFFYITGRMSAYRMDDAFNDKYIPIKCIPYEDSSKNQNLLTEMQTLFQNYKKVTENYEKARGIVNHYRPPEWKYVDNTYEIPAEQKTASAINLPENTGLGITPHEELLRQYGMAAGAEASRSQSQPEACLQEPSRHRRKLYRKQKGLQCSYCRYRRMAQTFSQLSLESLVAKQSSEEKTSICETRHGTPSQNRIGAISKDPERHHVESTDEQKSQKRVEQDISQFCLHTLTEKQSAEDKPSIAGTHHASPSQKPFGEIPKDPARHYRGSTGKQNCPKIKFSSLQIVEQDISQFSLHTLTEKQSAEDHPSIAGTHHASPSQNQTEAIPKYSLRHCIESTGGQKSQKSESSSVESLKQALIQWSLDFWAAKQSCEDKISIEDLFHKQKGQKSKYRQCPSFEQGFRRV